jgi:hypothetical protein
MKTGQTRHLWSGRLRLLPKVMKIVVLNHLDFCSPIKKIFFAQKQGAIGVIFMYAVDAVFILPLA